MFQDEHGTWWSDDRTYYRSGNEWLLYTTPSQQSATQPSYEGHPLGTAAIALQYSTETYHQPPQMVFGTNRQTPGEAATPAIILDPNFRAAASNNGMIWSFVQAMDKMATGQV